MMLGEMRLRIWDVQHGACAMVQHVNGQFDGRLGMIDSGCTDDWRPSTYIRRELGRDRLDYLFITNADQDHMADLRGLQAEGIYVDTLFRNNSYSGQEMRAIKSLGGPLSKDASWYVEACDSFNIPTNTPFNANMGGIQASVFSNPYPLFLNTNDLSLVVFFKYHGFKILFPGDLEKAGWLALLQRRDFCAELIGTNILVASHHGRENGYCPDIFTYFTPDAVVISDKPIEHDTQRTVPDYRRVVRDQGVRVRTTTKNRHVLTTRRDGWIQFTVNANGDYFIDTECWG
ncbi:beta-lactamase superfamily II metal-dependent hydrolase [Rhizobium leguminosarum]|uniref:ComEC/Rec2 family competence protein n=1 Tax=Rhizobium leguminosarum TaxID=384 RepID=UPI001FD97BCD|nr:hypothetical protein [Rhizobium leguminosarum]MDH6273548.1 beta-lactamase superfamily II metal-dependent hydrolase [Rhizobium leguminosarum]